MTTTNRSLRDVIQPIIERRLKEYEKYHGILNDEERALVRLIITSIVLSERLKKSKAMEKINSFTSEIN